MDQKKKLTAHLLLLLTAAIWGSAFVFQKFATEELSSWFITAARFSIAAAGLWVLTRKKWHLLDKSYLLGGIITGTTMGLGTAVQTVALALGTTPGKSAFLTAIYCVIVPFFYWIVSKDKPKKNHVAAAFLCLIGIGFISLTGDLTMLPGDFITLVCGIIFACDITAVAWFSKGRDPMMLTTMQITFSALIGWIGTFFTHGLPTAGISTGAFGNIMYLAVFSTGLCLFLQAYGLKYTEPAAGTILLSLESVFGVLFSILLYGEEVTLKTGIGFVIVFAAVLLAQLEFVGKKRAKAVRTQTE